MRTPVYMRMVLTHADGSRIYVTYTWDRKKIVFCELEETE